MSAISWSAESTTAPILTTPPGDKKAFVLNHIAGGKRVAEVCPASQLGIRPRPEMITTGIAELDAMTGGLPRGCLSEICGPASSGKSSVLLAALAAVTRRGESCVLIDTSDSFDPESGAAGGVDFGKLLWVRCGTYFKNLHHRENRVAQRSHRGAEYRLQQMLKTADLILQSGGFGLVALDVAGIAEKYVRRIPLASWFRFQRAVEHTRTALLVVSEFACAQTCASVVLKLSAQPSAISPRPSGKSLVMPPFISKTRTNTGGASEILRTEPSHTQLLEKIQIEVELARTRIERKPVRSAHAKLTTCAVGAG